MSDDTDTRRTRSGLDQGRLTHLIGYALAAAWKEHPSMGHAFREAVVGRIQAKLSEDTVLKLSGIADLGGSPSHYIQFKGTHRITDALHVEAGLDFLTGKPDTFWGRWGDNDRFFAVLRYLF